MSLTLGGGEEKRNVMDQSLLDGIINRLLEVRGRPGKQVQLSESEIRQLCLISREIFLQQPNLLELEAPIKICGTLSCFTIAIFAFITLLICLNWPVYSRISLSIRVWVFFFVFFFSQCLGWFSLTVIMLYPSKFHAS